MLSALPITLMLLAILDGMHNTLYKLTIVPYRERNPNISS